MMWCADPMKCLDFNEYRLLFELSNAEKKHLDECLDCRTRWQEMAQEREMANRKFNPDNETFVDPMTLPEGCRRVSDSLWEDIRKNQAPQPWPVIDWSRFDLKKLEQFLHDLPRLFPNSLPAGTAACVMHYFGEHQGDEHFSEGLKKQLESCGCNSEQIDNFFSYFENR